MAQLYIALCDGHVTTLEELQAFVNCNGSNRMVFTGSPCIVTGSRCMVYAGDPRSPIHTIQVVLSASSVPRVGKRAAVRRLHRADLVREMAGMLDKVLGEEEEDDEFW